MCSSRATIRTVIVVVVVVVVATAGEWEREDRNEPVSRPPEVNVAARTRFDLNEFEVNASRVGARAH